MPKFYFHLRDGHHVDNDDLGVELADLAAAHVEAVLAAREMTMDFLKQGVSVDNKVFEITDEAGMVVDRIPFIVALKPN